MVELQDENAEALQRASTVDASALVKDNAGTRHFTSLRRVEVRQSGAVRASEAPIFTLFAEQTDEEEIREHS
jgi:hypothetical protein